MSKKSEWQCFALKACKNGLSRTSVQKLLVTFNTEDFINFCQSKNENLLQLAEELAKIFQTFATADYDLEKSKEGSLAMDTVKLSFIIISALKGNASYSIMAGCFFPHIAEFIRRHLNTATALEKKSMPPKFFTIVEEFQQFSKDLPVYVSNFQYFLESYIQSMLCATPTIYHKVFLLILPFFEDTAYHQPIIQGILNYVADKKKNKFHFIGTGKAPSTVIFTVALVQHGLSFHSNSETCYQLAFSFAANFITSITKKCEEKVKNMVEFLDTFIHGLLLMMMSIDWPGARLLFHLMSKKLASLITEKPENKMMKFALRQMPAIGKTIRKFSLTWDGLIRQLSSEGCSENQCLVVKLLLEKFLQTKPEMPTVDLYKANSVLWEYLKRSKDDSFPLKLSALGKCQHELGLSEAVAAAYYFDFNTLSYSLYAKHILLGISSDKRDVKATAVKSLSDMITFEPKLLLLPNVVNVIDDCLASQPIKKAIAVAMGAFFNAHPIKILQFRAQFVRLFNDPDPQVRSAAVGAISAVLKKPEMLDLPAVSELLLKLIPLAEDEDVSVHRAVVSFFKTAWLGKGNVTSLISICKKPNVVNYIGTMLSTLQCHQRAVCLSQAPRALSNIEDLSQEELGDSIENLTSSLVDYLYTDDQELVETIMSILRTIANVIPSTVEPHLDVIIKRLGFFSETGKKFAAETLRSVLPLCSKEIKSSMATAVQKELEAETSLDWQVTTLGSFLKLFLSVADRGSISTIINTGFQTLKNVQYCEQVENAKEVKRTLCLIYVLCSHSSTKDSLLACFVKKPEYNLTLLSIACQVRLDLVPTADCAFLEKEVKKFLERTSNAKLTVAALYFIYCTLHGYKRHVQTPNIKSLGQSTTETVSDLLQSTLDKILDCSLHPDDEVRKGCSSVLALIAESGLILMPRLLPYICAMTTDPLIGVRNRAKKLLSRAAESWDISLDIVKGLNLAYTLAKSLKLGIVRGFDPTNGRATFHVAYELIQESPIKRRKFMNCIASELVNTRDVLKALYIADQISGMPFHYMDELLYALSEINRLVALHIGEKNFSNYLLKRVAAHFTSAHKISSEKITTYFPPKAKTTETVRQSTVSKDYIEKEVMVKISTQPLQDVVEQLPESDEESDSDEDDIPLEVLKQRIAAKKESLKKRRLQESRQEEVETLSIPQKENIGSDPRGRKRTKSFGATKKDLKTVKVEMGTTDKKFVENEVGEKLALKSTGDTKMKMTAPKRGAIEAGCRPKLEMKKLKVVLTPMNDLRHYN